MLEKTENIKYLGVYLDLNLKWDIPIDNVAKKWVKSIIPVLKMFKNILPFEIIKWLYFSLFESLLR